MILNHSNKGAVSVSRPARQFNEAFKQDAVRLLEQSGRPRAQVVRDLGVSDVSLSTWQACHGSAGAGVGAAREGEGPR